MFVRRRIGLIINHVLWDALVSIGPRMDSRAPREYFHRTQDYGINAMASRAYRSKNTIDPIELKGRRIGRALTKLKKVTRDQVQEALQLQKTRKEPLGQLLVGLGHITETDVMEALAGRAARPKDEVGRQGNPP